MSRRLKPSPSQTVADLLHRYPETVSVFVRNRMSCPGCPMAPFETLKDVMRAYGLDPAKFLGELKDAANGGVSPEDPKRSPPPRSSRSRGEP